MFAERPLPCKVLGRRVVLKLLALSIILSWARAGVNDRDFHFKRLVSCQNIANVSFSPDDTTKRNRFAGIERLGFIWNPNSGNFYVVKKQSSSRTKLLGRDVPKVLNQSGNQKSVCIKQLYLGLSLRKFGRDFRSFLNFRDSDVRSISSYVSVTSNIGQSLGLVPLPITESSSSENSDQGESLYNLPYLLAGIVFLLLSIVLLFKTWWKINFDITANVSVAAGGCTCVVLRRFVLGRPISCPCVF